MRDNKRKEQILEYLEANSGSKAVEIVNYFQLNASGVFRHLKKLSEDGLIYKTGKPPKVFYFCYKKNMKEDSFLGKQINWACSGNSQFLGFDTLCSTRDLFQARLEKLLHDLLKITSENAAYLLVAIVGEIGNNAFDHNLGNWRDVAGLVFDIDLAGREIILSDRGQGVLATIKRVKPDVKNDEDALRIAFTKVISGRFPEQRGNGLKFVKKVVVENNFYLKFYSGAAVCQIDSYGLKLDSGKVIIPGVLALIKF